MAAGIKSATLTNETLSATITNSCVRCVDWKSNTCIRRVSGTTAKTNSTKRNCADYVMCHGVYSAFGYSAYSHNTRRYWYWWYKSCWHWRQSLRSPANRRKTSADCANRIYKSTWTFNFLWIQDINLLRHIWRVECVIFDDCHLGHCSIQTEQWRRNVQFTEKIWEPLNRLGSLTLDSIKITPNMLIPICKRNEAQNPTIWNWYDTIGLCAALLPFWHQHKESIGRGSSFCRCIAWMFPDGTFQYPPPTFSIISAYSYALTLSRSQLIWELISLESIIIYNSDEWHLYCCRWIVCVPSFCMHEPEKSLPKRPEKAANRKIHFFLYHKQ